MEEGGVSIEDSIASSRVIGGRELREGFFRDIQSLTVGLVQARGASLFIGPLELMRFGAAKVGRNQVEWPIEGGWASAAPGGRLRIEARAGRLKASVDGYQPRIPVALYVMTQLPIHHLVTRLHLLRVRGRLPAAGIPAAPGSRLAAGAIDVGLCAAVALLAGRGRRLPAWVGIAAGYHVACWSLSGRTLGGAITKQRVVAVDGSRPSLGQAMLRFIALPLAALQLRAVHDEIACTDVIHG